MEELLMVTPYHQLRQIKHVTGWSQERIARETNLGLRTIGRVYGDPTYDPTEVTKRLIAQLHKKIIVSPFPEYVDWLFERYDYWKESLSKRDFGKEQDTLEHLLLNHKAIDSMELIACRLCWLLGHIHYDRAFYLKRNTLQSAIAAQEWYQKALEIIDHFSDESLIVQRYKIQQCVVSTMFNSCESGRCDNEKIRQWFADMSYLNIVRSVLDVEPWNWVVAKNGLVAASILRLRDECLFFWKAMQKVDKRFKDLDFAPSQKDDYWSSISDDPDLSWFVNLVRS